MTLLQWLKNSLNLPMAATVCLASQTFPAFKLEEQKEKSYVEKAS